MNSIHAHIAIIGVAPHVFYVLVLLLCYEKVLKWTKIILHSYKGADHSQFLAYSDR